MEDTINYLKNLNSIIIIFYKKNYKYINLDNSYKIISNNEITNRRKVIRKTISQNHGERRLNNTRKIDIFTNDLRKVYVKWNNERYDPFYNINNLNDLKTAENMIKNIIS